jgi:hypothetical protein
LDVAVATLVNISKRSRSHVIGNDRQMNLDNSVQGPRPSDDFVQYFATRAAAASVRGDIHAPDISLVPKLRSLTPIEASHSSQGKILKRADNEIVRQQLDLRREMPQRSPQIRFVIRGECGWTLFKCREAQRTKCLGIVLGEQPYFHKNP